MDPKEVYFNIIAAQRKLLGSYVTIAIKITTEYDLLWPVPYNEEY